MTVLERDAALTRLQEALEAIAQLQKLDRKAPEYLRWLRNTERAVENTFAGSERHVREFHQSLIVWQGVAPFDESDSSKQRRDRKAYLEGLTRAGALLESMIDE